MGKGKINLGIKGMKFDSFEEASDFIKNTFDSAKRMKKLGCSVCGKIENIRVCGEKLDFVPIDFESDSFDALKFEDIGLEKIEKNTDKKQKLKI